MKKKLQHQINDLRTSIVGGFGILMILIFVVSYGIATAPETNPTLTQLAEAEGWEVECVEHKPNYGCIGRNFAKTDCMSFDECNIGCPPTTDCTTYALRRHD